MSCHADDLALCKLIQEGNMLAIVAEAMCSKLEFEHQPFLRSAAQAFRVAFEKYQQVSKHRRMRRLRKVG